MGQPPLPGPTPHSQLSGTALAQPPGRLEPGVTPLRSPSSPPPAGHLPAARPPAALNSPSSGLEGDRDPQLEGERPQVSEDSGTSPRTLS